MSARACAGNRSSVTFVSCRQTISGPSCASQGTKVSRRTRKELTFQVAIRSMSSPRLQGAHRLLRRANDSRQFGGGLLAVRSTGTQRSRRAFFLQFVITQEAKAKFEGDLIFGDFSITYDPTEFLHFEPA